MLFPLYHTILRGMASLEQYRPDKIEPQRDDERYIFLIEDERGIVEDWIDAFGQLPNVRYVVPRIYLGFSQDLSHVPFHNVALVIVDQFLIDRPELHEEAEVLLSKIKNENPDALIIETSMVNPRERRSYTESHAAIWNFDDREVRTHLKQQSLRMLQEKIFVLEQFLFPAFGHAQLLDHSHRDMSTEDLQDHFETLKGHILYWTLFDHISCNPDQFEDAFALLPNLQKITLLHCAFSCLGHLDRGHDESFYSMMGMRIGYLVGLAQESKKDGVAGRTASID